MKAVTYTILCAGLALGAVACGSDDDAEPSEGASEQPVEIFSWWLAPGEAKALQALVDMNKQQHPGNRVFNAAEASGAEARARLAERLAASDPPDLFQQSAHELGAFLERNPGSLQPLNELFDAQSLGSTVMPDVLESVTVDGNVYAMPVDVHRENSLFYNKQIFADHHLNPPTTLESFLTACATLKAQGVTPIATGYQGWILRILFDSLAMGSMGADAYHAFMTGGARDDVALKAAIDLFGDVLENYVNADAGDPDFAWTDAAQAVFDGRAAMLLHGDWAKGYYLELGWTPGIDFGVLGAPSASNLFWYGVDGFSLPVGAPNKTGADDFLATVGSAQGQVAFNKLKGSTPIRPDVPRAQLDSEGRATLDAFQNADYRIAAVHKDEWDVAMLDFAMTRDKDALFRAYVEHPPVD
jgi:glucose/mannose transport system substrate-binding protein